MAFSEVYFCAGTEEIDGRENPFSVIAANKLDGAEISDGDATYLQSQSFLMSPGSGTNRKEQIIAAAARSAVYQRKVSRDARDAPGRHPVVDGYMNCPKSNESGEAQADDRKMQRQHRAGVYANFVFGEFEAAAVGSFGAFRQENHERRVFRLGTSAGCGGPRSAFHDGLVASSADYDADRSENPPAWERMERSDTPDAGRLLLQRA